MPSPPPPVVCLLFTVTCWGDVFGRRLWRPRLIAVEIPGLFPPRPTVTKHFGPPTEADFRTAVATSSSSHQHRSQVSAVRLRYGRRSLILIITTLRRITSPVPVVINTRRARSTSHPPAYHSCARVVIFYPSTYPVGYREFDLNSSGHILMTLDFRGILNFPKFSQFALAPQK